MNPGVQRLDAAVHDLRKFRVAGNFRDLDALPGQQARSVAGRKQFYAQAGQFTGKLHHPRFIGNADQGTANRLPCGIGQWSNPVQPAGQLSP